jgi:beta-hydroxylase
MFFGAESMVARASKVGTGCFFDPCDFPWVRRLEESCGLIQAELEQVLKNPDSIPCFQDISPDQEAITRDRRWKTFIFHIYGKRLRANCERCPQTARLLQTIPGMRTAFFSILMPNKEIPFHRGPYNGVLRYHLALKVPTPESSCGIVVGEEQAHWTEGRSLIFDDSHIHRAWNRSDQIRVVLFVDFCRPLRFPASVLNALYIWYMGVTPRVRAAVNRQKDWDQMLQDADKLPSSLKRTA